MATKSAHQYSQSSKGANTIIVSILIGIVLILIALLALSNLEIIYHTFGISSNSATISGTNEDSSFPLGKQSEDDTISVDPAGEYYIGKKVSLSGTLSRQSGDYTANYLLDTPKQKFGVQSSLFFLKDFIGDVTIGGEVIDYIENKYIINIDSIILLSPKKNKKFLLPTVENKKTTGQVYLPESLLFLSDFSGSNFAYTHNTQEKTLIIKPSVEVSQEVSLSGALSGLDQTLINEGMVSIMYFDCNPQSNLTDCAFLDKTFKDTSSVAYTTSEGDAFYTVPETTSVFGTIDNQVGYYIESQNKSSLVQAMQYVSFIGDKRAKETFTHTATDLCRSGNTTFYTIHSIETNYNDVNLVVSIKGKSSDNKEITCIVNVDPDYRLGGTVRQIIVGEEVINTTGNTEDAPDFSTGTSSLSSSPSTQSTLSLTSGSTSSLVRELEVEQVKVYTETGKQYTFDAKAGYSIIFPSKNIRFSPFQTTDKTLGYDGLYCEATYHVIAYTKDEEANKLAVDLSPQATIFVCSYTDKSKALVDTLSTQYFIHIDETKKKLFLTQPIDPARYDFAKHTQFN